MKRRYVRLAVAVALVAIGLGGLQASGAGQTAKPTNVITANRFSLTIDGYEIATFQEMTGIVAEVEPSEYWETSGSTPQVSKLAGAGEALIETLTTEYIQRVAP